MPRRLRCRTKKQDIKQESATVVAPEPEVIPRICVLPKTYSVANRLPNQIYNISVRAGTRSPAAKSVYENAFPIPNFQVYYDSPNTVTLRYADAVQLLNANADSVIDVAGTGPITVPWTVEPRSKPILIPRIIHQTYISRSMCAESYIACQSWWLANPNYEYRFYDDALCQTLMEQWYAADSEELQAYNMLYAGAYKSDIFRLALLLREGGVWADVSSVCEYPLDGFISETDEMIVCVDSPCQKRYANIHQAYIFVIPNHPAIQHILKYTVSTVIHRRFETPGMVFQSIAVTGPTAFAEGLNDYLGRTPLEFFDPSKPVHLFKEDDMSENPFRFTPFTEESGIRFLDHRNGRIWIDPNQIAITTKFPKFSQFRKNVHYSILGNAGYIYKVPMNTNWSFEPALQHINWQIWLQSSFVSRQMSDAMDTWISDSNFTHRFVTEQKAREETYAAMPEVWQAIDSLRIHAYKCDLLRALLLYLYGGLYVDADMVQIQSFKPLTDLHDILLLSSGPEQIDNGLMYFSKPYNPILLHYLNRAVAQIKSRVEVTSDLALTGPRLWTACVQEMLGGMPKTTDLTEYGLIAVLSHEAITPEYAETREVVDLGLTGLRLKALQTVSPGTTVVTWYNVPYACTKYPNYNNERLNSLNGTNFAAEFQAGSIYLQAL